ncbi:hypothetical protein V8F33_006657 [Rhypophila sp. PSN 637]
MRFSPSVFSLLAAAVAIGPGVWATPIADGPSNSVTSLEAKPSHPVVPDLNAERVVVLGEIVPEGSFQNGTALDVVFTEPGVENGGNADKRSYQNTCFACRVEGVFLVCQCHNQTGFEGTSALNLNGCLLNHWGVLHWKRNGLYGESCNTNNVEYTSNHFYRVDCLDYWGGWSGNSMLLTASIHNYNGVLGCDVAP